VKAIAVICLSLMSIVSFAQQGKITQIRKEYIVSNEKEKKLTCRLMSKINLIESDTLTYVMLSFTDEYKKGNRGYIYLSNEAELNSFMNDLNTCLAKFAENEAYQGKHPKYMVQTGNMAFYNSYSYVMRISIHETVAGTYESFISFKPDKILELLNWLRTVHLTRT
jgi:hypothetical protein